MTQLDAASQVLAYRYFQELERGERNPTLKTLFEIARLLKVRVCDLVDVDEPRDPVRLHDLVVEELPKGRKPAPKSRIKK